MHPLTAAECSSHESIGFADSRTVWNCQSFVNLYNTRTVTSALDTDTDTDTAYHSTSQHLLLHDHQWLWRRAKQKKKNPTSATSHSVENSHPITRKDLAAVRVGAQKVWAPAQKDSFHNTAAFSRVIDAWTHYRPMIQHLLTFWRVCGRSPVPPWRRSPTSTITTWYLQLSLPPSTSRIFVAEWMNEGINKIQLNHLPWKGMWGVGSGLKTSLIACIY